MGPGPAELKKKVTEKLTKAGIRVFDRPAPKVAQAQLQVSVILTKLDCPDLYAYYIDTAVWGWPRPKKDDEVLCPAQLWRPRQRNIHTATRKETAAKINKTVIEHIDEFLKAYLTQNPPPGRARNADDANSIRSFSKQEERPSDEICESAKTEYKYVASRNGRVFHRPDCPFARRISPKNLVGFTTKAEAVNAGKRPCKRCRP